MVFIARALSCPQDLIRTHLHVCPCRARQAWPAYVSHLRSPGETTCPGLTPGDSDWEGLAGEQGHWYLLWRSPRWFECAASLGNTAIRRPALCKDCAYLCFSSSLSTKCPAQCLATGLAWAQKVKPVNVGSSQYVMAASVEWSTFSKGI